MATLPYDLTTFALKDCTSGVIIFNHLATREIVITEGMGWVETAPSEDVTAAINLNGSPISGASITITSGGVVTVVIPNPTTINAGDLLQAVMNADADVPATKAAGVAVTFVATEGSDCYEDNRYDLGCYIEGTVPAGRTLTAIVIPRQMHILDNEFWGTTDTNATNNITLDVRKNGSSIGSIVVQNNGAVVFMISMGVQNFVKGDILSIFSPGTLGTDVDTTLQDLSFTIKAFLGPG